MQLCKVLRKSCYWICSDCKLVTPEETVEFEKLQHILIMSLKTPNLHTALQDVLKFLNIVEIRINADTKKPPI